MLCTDLNIDRAKRARNAAVRIQEPTRDDVMREMSWTLGIGLSLGQGSVLGQVAAFYPTDISGWYYFVDPDKYTSLTPGTTLKSSGTTPPVVTLSGTKASRGAVRIECTSTTLFRWGYDNDGTTATWIQTGQTIPAGGSAFTLGSTGLAATFPTGTYAADNVYQETVQTIADQSNGSQSFTNTTAAQQPRLIKAINSKYCLRFDGVDDNLFCSAVDLAAPTGANPVWAWGVGRVDAFGVNNAIWSGNSAMWLEQTGSTSMAMVAASNGSVMTYAVGTAARWICNFTGATDTDSSKWGATAGTAVNAGSNNSSAGMYLGSLHNVAATYANCTVGAQGIANVAMSGANLTNLESWGSGQYGAGLF